MEGSDAASEPLLRIERSDRDGVPHLELVGELDLSTAGPFKLRFELAERDAPETIVVDLRRVTFMDSIGLGMIQQLFELTGTQDQFDWMSAPA